MALVSERLLTALAVTLAAGAVAVTAGSVVEHRDTGYYEASATGVLRDLGGVAEGRALGAALIESIAVAEELRRNRTFVEDPAALRRDVEIEVSGPTVRVAARGANADYAALLANRWFDGANSLLDRWVAAREGPRLEGLGVPRSSAGVLAVERRTARSTARLAFTGLLGRGDGEDATRLGLRLFDAPDLVAVTQPAEPPEAPRRPSWEAFLRWLGLGLAAGAVAWLLTQAALGSTGSHARTGGKQ